MCRILLIELNKSSNLVVRLAEFEFETVPKSESSKNIRQRVERAWEIQRTRFTGTGTFCNAGMSSKELGEFCQIGQEGKDLLKQAAQRFSLSVRAYTRILKLARTIADLEASSKIEISHLAEARKGFVLKIQEPNFRWVLKKGRSNEKKFNWYSFIIHTINENSATTKLIKVNNK